MLRGLSILAVVLLHIRIAMHFVGTEIGRSLPGWLAYLLFNNDGNGVTVFFAISGFLITLTSVRRFGSLDRMRPGAFYRIRFARIAPPLLLLLAVLSVLHLSGIGQFHIRPSVATLPRALLAALTFHLNWLEAAHGFLPGNWDVLWSLSVEEMFYLFFPLLCVLLLRLKRGMWLVLATLLGFVAMAPFAKTIWTTNEIWQEKSYVGGMGGIAMGCLAALLVDWLTRRGGVLSRNRAKWLGLVEFGGIVLMLFVAEWRWPHWAPIRHALGRSATDDTLLALGTCLVMVATTLRGARGSWLTAPIRWFGRHSYEVYLTHEFVVVGGRTLYVYLDRRGPLFVWIVAILVLSAPLGAALARYFSEPMNRYLRGAAAPRGETAVHGSSSRAT